MQYSLEARSFSPHKFQLNLVLADNVKTALRNLHSFCLSFFNCTTVGQASDSLTALT